MACSKFDVDYGLSSRPATNARLYNIISEAQDRHADLQAEVTLPDPPAAVAAEPSNVLQRTRQEKQADIENNLAAFQKMENEKFSRQESGASHRSDLQVSPEEYIDSDQELDDEGMELDPRYAGEPDPRILPPEQNVQGLDPVQANCDQRCSVAEKQLKVSIHVDSEKVAEAQSGEFLSGAGNTEPGKDESLTGAEVLVPTRDYPASPSDLPPVEEKFTEEMIIHIDPFSDSEASVSLTAAAAPLAALQLPLSTSDLTLKICDSNLEIIQVTSTVPAARPFCSVSEGSVKSADGSNVLEGDSDVMDDESAA